MNGVLGFAMMFALVLCIGNVEDVLQASQSTGYAFIAIFEASIPSKGGVFVMTLLITVLAMVSSVGVFATASRMSWSFARDGGLPFSKQLSRVCFIFYS